MIISNLPLLFMNGYPTRLDRMPVETLETFITFLVRCSLGHDTAKKILKPDWWPARTPFKHPFKRLKTYRSANWRAELDGIVKRCYEYHKSEHMIKFSELLASFSKDYFIVVKHWNGTSSFLERKTNRLVVTIRDELITYDQKKYQLRRRDTLQKNIETVNVDDGHTYMCPNCYMDFNSQRLYKCHQQTCFKTSDLKDPLTYEKTCESDVEIIEDSATKIRDNFLRKLGLYKKDQPIKKEIPKSTFNQCDRYSISTFIKHTDLEFSSLIGQHILKRTNRGELAPDELQERLTRLERLTSTKVMPSKGKRSTQNSKLRNKFPVVCRKKCNKKSLVERPYLLNSRAYRQKQFLGLSKRSQLLYSVHCRKCTVPLRNLSSDDIAQINSELKSGEYYCRKTNWTTNTPKVVLNSAYIPPPIDIIEIFDSDDEVDIQIETSSVITLDDDDDDDDDVQNAVDIETLPDVDIFPKASSSRSSNLQGQFYLSTYNTNEIDTLLENRDPLEEQIYNKENPVLEITRRSLSSIQFKDIPFLINVE